MQYVIRKLFSDDRSTACGCSIRINPVPRAAPKLSPSGFDNFVESLTKFLPAEAGNEDRTREAGIEVIPPLRPYLRCSPRPRAVALFELDRGQGSQTARWIGLPYATNRRRTSPQVFNWFAIQPCIDLRSTRIAWIKDTACENAGFAVVLRHAPSMSFG